MSDDQFALIPKNISSLNLKLCHGFTGTGLKQLPCRNNLRSLKLGSYEITNDHLAALTSYENLDTLDLSICQGITDAGMKFVASLKLTTLDLSGCREITDSGVKNLKPLNKKLIELKLRDCRKITDEGVAVLHSFEKLANLDLSGCSGIKTRKENFLRPNKTTTLVAMGLI